MKHIKKTGDTVGFVMFIISAAAMDSGSIIVPGAICLLSISFLYIRSKNGECQWKNVGFVEETVTM